MSKKKKQNLQKLIAKKQQLQQVSQGSVLSFNESSQVETLQKPEVSISQKTFSQPRATRDRALRKTAASIIVIALLLVAAVIFDKKSPYLNQFGDWIYAALKLQG